MSMPSRKYKYPKKDEFVFFKNDELVKRLTNRNDPMEMDHRAKITATKAVEIIEARKLFIKNDGGNGLVAPSGHFLPCAFEGHMYLYAVLGINNTFNKDKEIDLTADIVGDRCGWIKISDYVVHSIYRPTKAQLRTFSSIEDNGSSLQYNPDLESMRVLALPPSGYNSFMFGEISLSKRLDGVYTSNV